MKVPLAEQIEAVKAAYRGEIDETGLNAAVATLMWVERHQAELRVLGEFPIEKIEVLTPHSTAVSAIGQEADEGEFVALFTALDGDGNFANWLAACDEVIRYGLDTENERLRDAVDTLQQSMPTFLFRQWVEACANASRDCAIGETPCVEAVNSQSGGEE